MKPKARDNGLLVRELGGETVVYDLERHQAHCLNPSSSSVFRRCDGDRTVESLVDEVRAELGPEVDERFVGLALEGLDAAHLLEPAPAALEPPDAGRRELLRRAGMGAALLLPAVVSMVAPTPVEAAVTCIPVSACSGNDGQPCYIPPDTAQCATRTCIAGACL